MSTEDVCIKNIEAAIRGIKMGTKKPEDVASSVSTNIERLKGLNEGMATDLMNNYKSVLKDYKNRK